MQDPDGPGPGRKAMPMSQASTGSTKTMTVRFSDGTTETIRQGAIYQNHESGWTTVVAGQEEIVLRVPCRLVESFGITSD